MCYIDHHILCSTIYKVNDAKALLEEIRKMRLSISQTLIFASMLLKSDLDIWIEQNLEEYTRWCIEMTTLLKLANREKDLQFVGAKSADILLMIQ